jgi:SAM-dependent methyltransferase
MEGESAMSGNTGIHKAYYDQRFGEQSQQLNEEELIRWNAMMKALNELKSDSPLRIAEFGCGRGWLCGRLASLGEVTGFDLSERAIENARSSYPGIEFHALDATRPIPPEYCHAFDLVVSSEVIEHVHDQQGYLGNISSMLKKGGYLLLTTPNGRWKEKFYADGREAWKQPLENWLSEEMLTGYCRNAGFKIEKTSTFNAGWLYDLRPRMSIAFVALPLFRKVQKAFRLYRPLLDLLNRRGFGLNLLLIAKKE